MNEVRSNPLRQRFSEGATAYGVWITLESPSVSEICVVLGMDWIAVDMEHGHLEWRDVLEHVRVARGTDTAVLVRVPRTDESYVKRALDLGADGVLLPLVRGRSDVDSGMRFGRYPPRGVRGVGGERAVCWGLGMEEYLQRADAETLIIPLIETKEAIEDIEAILSVSGMEAIFFGPADLSASFGYLGAWEGPGVSERILEVRAAAAQRGIQAGVMSRSSDDALTRTQQQFSMVGLGSDVGLFIRAVSETKRAVGRQSVPHLWF